jgi:hypothetical protein
MRAAVSMPVPKLSAVAVIQTSPMLTAPGISAAAIPRQIHRRV